MGLATRGRSRLGRRAGPSQGFRPPAVRRARTVLFRPRGKGAPAMAATMKAFVMCPGGAERMRRLLRLLQTGRVDPTPLTTHRFRFAQVEKAFRMMKTKEDGVLKPLLLFG